MEAQVNDPFIPYPKIPRLSRQTCVITEKIDGTNAQILVRGDTIVAGSRSRVITTADDHFGFARWVEENKSELLKLGDGLHYGEWWGSGIQRRYGLTEKRFSLFKSLKWSERAANDPNWPKCVSLVPVLAIRQFDAKHIDEVFELLRANGSTAAPGFMQPEGIVVRFVGQNYKKTFEYDDKGKEAACLESSM